MRISEINMNTPWPVSQRAVMRPGTIGCFSGSGHFNLWCNGLTLILPLV
jgi:hypothetical protein